VCTISGKIIQERLIIGTLLQCVLRDISSDGFKNLLSVGETGIWE